MLPERDSAAGRPQLGILPTRGKLVAVPGVRDAGHHVLAHHRVQRRVRQALRGPGLDGLVVRAGEELGAGGREGGPANDTLVGLPHGHTLPSNRCIFSDSIPFSTVVLETEFQIQIFTGSGSYFSYVKLYKQGQIFS